MGPVTAPTSTPQETTLKQASEATDTQKEPTPKQGGDVTETDEGGQLVGVSARKKICKNPQPQVHVFLILFLLFLKHFFKCRSETLHSKLVHSFYRIKVRRVHLKMTRRPEIKKHQNKLSPQCSTRIQNSHQELVTGWLHWQWLVLVPRQSMCLWQKKRRTNRLHQLWNSAAKVAHKTEHFVSFSWQLLY